MLVLNVPQNSEVSDAIHAGQTIVQRGQLVWSDNGQPVVFPIKLSETRQRTWIPPVYNYANTFDDLCRKFPSLVVEMTEDDFFRGCPSWGSGWYTRDERGFAECLKSNWDSSD